MEFTANKIITHDEELKNVDIIISEKCTKIYLNRE